jgi:hypothetical protein
MLKVVLYLVFAATLARGFINHLVGKGGATTRWTQLYVKASGEGLGLNKPPMELCDESATQVMDEIRNELGTIFGYTADSRAVGITGEIDLIEVDGPTMVVALRGRFWHATDTVMMRVESYIKNRIPEVIDVILDTKNSQIQDDNRLNTDGGKKRLF